MVRATLAVAILALLSAAPARAGVDPEPPPRNLSEARAGDFVVKLAKSGVVTGTKQGRFQWRHVPEVSPARQGQVAISGERVAVWHGGVLSVLELKTGKPIWRRTGGDASTKVSVEGDRLTLRTGGMTQVFDVATGKLLEVRRLKR